MSKYVELITKEGTPVLHIRLADNFWLRLKGLLGKEGLSPKEGLLLAPCRSVHTIGMKFAIDLVFLDKDNRVLAVYRNVPPGKPGITVKNAAKVLETAAGVTDKFPCPPGAQLHFKTGGA
ncbi:MAG TPA: DUF192 domain-containing protein [Firmicutes bacterium]|jgi:uncharacterized membrane protein (UPF0127 family)|nr:DUF192 domain-containing protein [Bacillota bacterium]HOQ23104.1 DUF192 domain-containing protein [Bacillota bacterium]HPT67001.1 DUF192 domain-containing protein [Bacillota bacterium]